MKRTFRVEPDTIDWDGLDCMPIYVLLNALERLYPISYMRLRKEADGPPPVYQFRILFKDGMLYRHNLTFDGPSPLLPSFDFPPGSAWTADRVDKCRPVVQECLRTLAKYPTLTLLRFGVE